MKMISNTTNSRTQTVLLGPHDVLLGRGTGPNEHVGNIKFRALIREAIIRSGMKGLDAKMKSRLAMDVVAQVKALGGRFLRKSKLQHEGTSEETEEDHEEVVVGSHNGGCFEELSDALAHGKTKQSFRHQLRILTRLQEDIQTTKAVPSGSLSPSTSTQFSTTMAYLVDGILKRQSLTQQHQSLRDIMSPFSFSLLPLFLSNRASILRSIAAKESMVKADYLSRKQTLFSRNDLLQHLPVPDHSQRSSSDLGIFGTANFFGDLGAPHQDPESANNGSLRGSILQCHGTSKTQPQQLCFPPPPSRRPHYF